MKNCCKLFHRKIVNSIYWVYSTSNYWLSARVKPSLRRAIVSCTIGIEKYTVSYCTAIWKQIGNSIYLVYSVSTYRLYVYVQPRLQLSTVSCTTSIQEYSLILCCNMMETFEQDLFRILCKNLSISCNCTTLCTICHSILHNRYRRIQYNYVNNLR